MDWSPLSFAPCKIVWSKPTPVGASILDLSKLSLYKFHYEEMKPRFGDNKSMLERHGLTFV